jgi:predicted nucleic acid-binding protein
MTVVVDASVVVAMLVDSGRDGRWAEDVIAGEHLVAPHLMPVEVSSTLRRLAAAGVVSDELASLAHADLVHLRVDHVDFEPCAERVWNLRRQVTSYDAWYVAVAERLDVPLATLDRRLARSTGLRCEIVHPPD